MQFSGWRKENVQKIIGLLALDKDPSFSDKKRKLWEWEHLENPFKTDEKSVGLELSENDEIVGYNGLMPVMLKCGDRLLSSAWSFDTILSPKYRGKGHGKVLANTVKMSYPVVLGLGISDVQESIMRKQGYIVNTEIEQFYFTNKAHGFRDYLKVVGQKVLSVVRHELYYTESEMQVSIIKASDASQAAMDSLWERVKNDYHNAVVRNFEYIRWKYGAYPLDTFYLIQVMHQRELKAVGVFRKNKKLASLVDYIGSLDDRASIHQVVSTFMGEADDSELLECVCTNDVIKEVLRSVGFRHARVQPRFYIYSSVVSSGLERDWFVMGGDSDLN
jgi:hypothetical protein